MEQLLEDVYNELDIMGRPGLTVNNSVASWQVPVCFIVQKLLPRMGDYQGHYKDHTKTIMFLETL